MDQIAPIFLLFMLALGVAYVVLRRRILGRPAPVTPRRSRASTRSNDFSVSRLPNTLESVSVILAVDYNHRDDEYLGWVYVFPGTQSTETYFPAPNKINISPAHREAFWSHQEVGHATREAIRPTLERPFRQAVSALEGAGWHVASRSPDQPDRRLYRLSR